MRRIARARLVFSQIAVKKLRYAGAAGVRILGGMTSAVNWLAGLAAGPISGYALVVFAPMSPFRAELAIRDDLRTVGGALHGGTLMALADTVGAVATMFNLPSGAGTTTLASKTNFFAAGRAGLVRAEATPLHRGKRTMVWQTRVADEAGRLHSQTIQTQMVLV